MSQCQDRGCDKEATHYPEITIAPYGYPIGRGLKIQFGIELCLFHARTVKSADLFTDEDTKKRLREVTRITTKSEVPLDFTRTRVTPRRIGDELWLLLKKAATQ
jgi:hypothetical protein